MESSKRVIMNRDAIGFFKAVLESYEEVALITVFDGKRGEVELTYPSSLEETVQAIMEDMRRYSITFEGVDCAR
jgi:Domain of unknown function (DUF4911)